MSFQVCDVTCGDFDRLTSMIVWSCHPCARKGWFNEKGSTVQTWKCGFRQTTQDLEFLAVGKWKASIPTHRHVAGVPNKGSCQACGRADRATTTGSGGNNKGNLG